MVLHAHQAVVDATKSPQRDVAAEYAKFIESECMQKEEAERSGEEAKSIKGVRDSYHGYLSWISASEGGR